MLREIEDLTTLLIEEGLVDDQNFPHLESDGSVHTINCPNGNFPALLKNEPYGDVFRDQVTGRSHNMKMLDGALVQMSYEFGGTSLRRARLAFLPSPDLHEFQNNPDLYLEELLYADVVDKRVVTVPLRFDFDSRSGVAVPLEHPVSHLTLGQYHACRIAAVGALTPSLFMAFVLRSFYGQATVALSLPRFALRFDKTIFSQELELVHIGVPCTT